MGSSSSITYAVPITHKIPGESAIYRFPDFKDKLFDRPEDDLRTMKDVFLNSYRKYAHLPALGKRITTQALLSRRREALMLSSSPTGQLLSRRKRSAVPSSLKNCSAYQRAKD